ncbi:hypothetical protein EG329_007696 [Mollisiaceae sp. DMI_Dod_QoI]|nr:hypothetical protein EG329_007696 [Helotiales sp. DMI_Dod_QoI]
MPFTPCRSQSNVNLTQRREIERLRAKIKELESQIVRDQINSSPIQSAPHEQGDVAHPSRGKDYSDQRESVKRSSEGIHSRTAHANTQWYGPSSSFYFMGRMSTYLRSAIQFPISDEHMLPNSASRRFASPIYSKKVILEDNTWTTDASAREEYLTGIQEEYFLGNFWQSYHCTYQILDEAEFKAHYKSLWASGGHTRKPSALVDVVLAICMQYGIAFLPRKGASPETKTSVDANDVTIAGRWYHHRCQTLLTAELESPSISTLQCHILSVVYLCNASFQNMAHTTLAVAVRTAHILGLHLEPPDIMPRAQRELRKRIWWTLYALESKTCMALGRPISAQLSDIACSLPTDDHELASSSGSNFAPVEHNVTWLTYGILLVKLVIVARATYNSFNEKCADMMSAAQERNLYNSNEMLETAADFLISEMKHLLDFRDDVPEGLKTKRKDAEEPFSTDRSSLEVELFAPLWLRRQRVFLELLYHNLSMNLYRPFICFTPFDHATTPKAEWNSVSCIKHAMIITHIMHQMLTETEIVHGWHEAFHWQFNAMLSTVGFILAYPNHSLTNIAQESIHEAIDVLELLGNNFAIAASAAVVARDLTAKADFLRSRFNGPSSIGPESLEGRLDHTNGSIDEDSTLRQDNTFLDRESDDFAGSAGFSFSMDNFHSFEWLAADTSSISDTWNFMQE